MSAEPAPQPFAAKLIRLTTPPPGAIEAVEAKARTLVADAEAMAQAKLAEAERIAKDIIARAQAQAQALVENERVRLLAEHRAALARDAAGLKVALSELIADAVEKIVGALPAEAALAGAVQSILSRLGDLTSLQARAEPQTLEDLRRALGDEAAGLRFERDPALRPGRVLLVGADIRAEADVAHHIAIFKALARGEA
jgi:hypothetical protein